MCARDAGPSRHFGGDAAVADLVHERLAEVVAERTDVRVGVADGPSPPNSLPAANPTRLVLSGEVAGFRPMKVDVLERPELADVLAVSGCARSERSPTCRASDVLALVSAPTVPAPIALCAGATSAHLTPGRPPVDWTVSDEIDPPADRVDWVAPARTLADELHR